MEDKKAYFCSYKYCTLSDRPDTYFARFNPDTCKAGMQEEWEEAITYPVANKTGSHYIEDDNWACWLGKMNTYTFENISFTYENDKGEKVKENRIFPNCKPGKFMINAFTLVQARNILLSNIKYYGTQKPDEGPNKTVSDIRFEVGSTYLGFKEGSDCDPKTWGWARYFDVVSKKLAFERGLIPEGKEGFFANFINAAEILNV